MGFWGFVAAGFGVAFGIFLFWLVGYIITSILE